MAVRLAKTCKISLSLSHQVVALLSLLAEVIISIGWPKFVKFFLFWQASVGSLLSSSSNPNTEDSSVIAIKQFAHGASSMQMQPIMPAAYVCHASHYGKKSTLELQLNKQQTTCQIIILCGRGTRQKYCGKSISKASPEANK